MVPISNTNAKFRSRQAFTLIELLVVISIIVLLIAVLLPALGKARKAANGIKCASSLRQVLIANEFYLMDNKSIYMPYGYNTILGVQGAAWPEVASNATVWIWTIYDAGAVTSTQMFHCPEHPYANVDNTNRNGSVYSYGYNWNGSFNSPSQLGPNGQENWGGLSLRVTDTGGVRQIVRQDDLLQASSTLVFGDTRGNPSPTDALGSARLDHENTDFRARTFGDRHNGSGNAAWADGHVTIQKRETLSTTSGAAGLVALKFWTRWKD